MTAGDVAMQRRRNSGVSRLVWFAALWLASVATLAVVALVLRVLMGWAGLTR